jgi:hypothetical protein
MAADSARPRSPAARAMKTCIVHARQGPGLRRRSLERGVRSKDARAVRRGGAGNVPRGQLAGGLPYDLSGSLRRDGRNVVSLLDSSNHHSSTLS